MLRYQVEDMTCGHCAQTITQAVKSVDASADVAIDLRSKQVNVAGVARADAVAAAIRDAGYTPVSLGEAPKALGSGCCAHC